jgi:hypothetical protein
MRERHNGVANPNQFRDDVIGTDRFLKNSY